ncbi:Putative aminopeptidase W07G4.4 [Echinococcus granulosus]|uniref:Aminopeptidase W07G4.4 n=2 Tax=Echinococcus granulosus TaxID=6210 RepID=W6V9X3_ECHGR|nr:Putative aminopeptidase W07G4.4 [Echinococcus granulosus]EUB63494.1 Putative aminopeptidase W07G4.4 [Echinococcus granulosus]
MRIGSSIGLAYWLNLGIASANTCPELVAFIPSASPLPESLYSTTMSLVVVCDVLDESFDVVIFINDAIKGLGCDFVSIEDALCSYERVNPKISETYDILAFPAHPCHRLIFSPTGKLNGDVDDSRNIYDAAVAGVKKAVAIGCEQPLLVLGPIASAPKDALWAEGEFPLLNAVLGALHALYQPLEIREAFPHKQTKYTELGVFGASEDLLKVASAIEEGRRVARDIGGSDPERMAAPRIVDYLQEEFQNCPDVTVSVTDIDPHVYPLMAAVDRATSSVERYRGRVVHLEYCGGEKVDTSLFLVGKGITFDTGGHDIKAGGVMAGMHRDKCGAAAVAGFLRTLSLLRPAGLRVVAHLAFVRNAIGPDAYVADEIITSRAGKRVRIGNTDAEGRMVMSDLLCLAKEEALHAVNPFLFTVATLTGHVIRAYKCYTASSISAVMDNGPARKLDMSHKLQKAGERISDMAEVSTVRMEDFEMCKGHTEYEDLLQCNNLPSSATPRGHQFPAAFMILASGLEKHGLGCEKQLPYTHIDVAGSAGLIDTLPTAAPLMMLTSMFVLPRVWSATKFCKAEILSFIVILLTGNIKTRFQTMSYGLEEARAGTLGLRRLILAPKRFRQLIKLSLTGH